LYKKEKEIEICFERIRYIRKLINENSILLEKEIDSLYEKIDDLLLLTEKKEEQDEFIPLPSHSKTSQENQDYLLNNSELTEFQKLNTLLNDSIWENAIELDLLCDPDSYQDLLKRSKNIFNTLISEDMTNKSFLDFGCGEGYMNEIVSKMGCSKNIGYDVKEYHNWLNVHDVEFYTNFKEIENNKFDIILVHDVVYHSQESVDSILEKLNKVLNEDGKIFVRVHPFMSRHGGHLYNKMNKSYVHLIFTEEELDGLGLKLDKSIVQERYVIKSFREHVAKSNFKILEEDLQRQDVDRFFSSNILVKKRIMDFWGGNKFPELQLSLDFVDFVLVKK